MMIYGTDGHIVLSVHGNEPIKIEGINGTRHIDIKNPACIEEPMIETVVNELLGFGTCPCTGEGFTKYCKSNR